MPLTEFDLIKQYFSQQSVKRSDVLVGIGDDAALVTVPKDHLLATSIDTLVAGIHFPESTHPADIAYKALAVNLSDLAAMGAEPSWITLALTLPKADPDWLAAFSKGLFSLANQFNVQLIGGDTTRGPLTVTIQINGFVPEGKAIRRNGAKIGDKIYVSGTLGNAGLGLQVALKKIEVPEADEQFALLCLNRPSPQIALGITLRDIANSAIDISDGLLADLNHILEESNVGACIELDKLPLSNILLNHLSLSDAQEMALTAGDDYELCFTVPAEHESVLANKNCYCIGTIEEKKGLRISGEHKKLTKKGFQHF